MFIAFFLKKFSKRPNGVKEDWLSRRSGASIFTLWIPVNNARQESPSLIQQGGNVMRECYQRGYLRCVQRKQSPATWEFRWRELDAKGKTVRRTAVIGTIE